VAGAPAQSAATVGGLPQSVNNAWVLDPRRRVDAKVAEGLPASDEHLPPDELLYAVFVRVTNEHRKPRQMVSDIALRDARNREFAPTRVAPDNRFAYGRPSWTAGRICRHRGRPPKRTSRPTG